MRRIELFRWMLRARMLDERMAKLKAQGEVAGSVFLGRGQEAFSAAAGINLRPGDLFAPLIRDQAGRLAFGETYFDVVRTVMGRSTGPMRGRDGNIHRGNWDIGLLPMISHLGAMVSVLSGALLARRLSGRLRSGDLDVGVCSIGDGGMATGALHEGLNVAAVERLPMVLLVANNQYAYSTTNDRSFACKHLVDRAQGYGIAGRVCDGTDADACLREVSAAMSAARRGQGPQMVVADLLRLAGHGTHDDMSYVGADMKSRYADCVPVFEQRLVHDGVMSANEMSSLKDQIRGDIEAVITQVRGEAQPDPDTEIWSALCETQLTTLRSAVA
ncbi:MAG: thiamine pyrophosphate-dependent dehydrogenase E1 component subunit alpha [Planctomycetota bacterium]